MALEEQGFDLVRDTSRGLPALSADRSRVALVFDEAVIVSFSHLSFQVLSTSTGAPERATDIVDLREVIDPMDAEPSFDTQALGRAVSKRVEEANRVLVDGGYTAMVVSTKLDERTRQLGRLTVTLDGGRFTVTDHGHVCLDLDARSWAAGPVSLDDHVQCTFEPVLGTVAFDPTSRMLVVVAEQRGQGGGDACDAPRGIKTLSL